MDKWEYMSEFIDSKQLFTLSPFNRQQLEAVEVHLLRRLNELGRDGWEVMTIAGGPPIPVSVTDSTYVWFVRCKRRKP